MKIGKNANKTTMKIVSATAVVIFTLFATVFATFAWFSAALIGKTDSDEFEVVRVTSGAGIESINLIKFEYPINNTTHKYDYSRGQDGQVKKFVLTDGSFIDENDHVTSVLTTYDPAEKIVLGESYSLFNSNCQAFYEITFTSEKFGNFILNASAVWNSDAEKEKDRDIFLSDCVDFCIFTVSDISNAIGINTDTNKPYYYPTYIDFDPDDLIDYDPVAPAPISDMNTLENLYYRLSYQASVKTQSQLAHFYPTQSQQAKSINATIATDIPVTFTEVNNTYTVYVGVNYAPSELEQYYKDIYLSDINAIYDYTLSFSFTEVQNP